MKGALIGAGIVVVLGGAWYILKKKPYAPPKPPTGFQQPPTGVKAQSNPFDQVKPSIDTGLAFGGALYNLFNS